MAILPSSTKLLGGPLICIWPQTIKKRKKEEKKKKKTDGLLFSLVWTGFKIFLQETN